MLAALPLVLALAAFYRDQLAGAVLPRPQGDAAFYAYQLARAAECHGRWWRVAEDSQIGHPYPSEFAKHPGLFEGVDLMLLATLSGGMLGAAATYHLAVLAALAVNGWIAALFVWRATRSAWWAAVSITLITLNQSVAMRIVGHLHLFKFGWAIVAVGAFVGFLEQATWRRGLLMGLAGALMLQSSYYLGFLMALGLGFLYVVEAAAGRMQRGHLVATVVAAGAFAVLGAALCFPAWTGLSALVASGQFFRREWWETWTYGSELWKYLVPKGSALANSYFRDIRLQATPPAMDEGWNFPGYTALVALLVFAISRLRGTATCANLGRFASVSLGLMAFFTVLSLAGGPSALIYFVVPSFRCYGRAGLLVVALGSLVAPIVLCELLRSRSRPVGRVLLTIAVICLVVSDAWRAAVSFPGWPPASRTPDWVAWLKHQPSDLRMAVFAQLPAESFSFYSWGVNALEWRPAHAHATLNGADFALFEADLRLLGASYRQLNPAALRFVVSLGYEALCFHRDYLAENDWIASLPWLERVEQRGDWLICRADPRLVRLPSLALEQILALPRRDPEPREAPPGSWITDTWPVAEDVVALGPAWALLAWTDDRGRPVSDPKLALYQHIFGPEIPAYTIRTPGRPGSYRLVIQDARLRPRSIISYRIVEGLPLAQTILKTGRTDLTVSKVVLPAAVAKAPHSAVLTLVNAASRYVQAQAFREFVDPVAQTHPGTRSRWPRANVGGLVVRITPCGGDPACAKEPRELLLPRDLLPGQPLKIELSSDRLPPNWADRALEVEPVFAGLEQAEQSWQRADIKISVERPRSLGPGRRAKVRLSKGADQYPGSLGVY